MDNTTLTHYISTAAFSVIGSIIATAVAPPVSFEIGSGFAWGISFGIIAGISMWADSALRNKEEIRFFNAVIVGLLSLVSGFLGYVALSATDMSSLIVTGGTTVSGLLGGPGLRAIHDRGMKELRQALGKLEGDDKSEDK